MEMIVFSGVQGAGKSTFYQHRFSTTHVRLSLDMLRTRNREGILLFACLAAQQPMVIDNTNPTASHRARYATIARAAGFRTILYFFDISLEAAIIYNAQRLQSVRVPEVAVRGTFAKLQRPAIEEPFNESFSVTLQEDGSRIVQDIFK